MSEWKDYKLSDLMEIKYGKDHKHLADGSYPLFGSGGIMRYVEKSIYEEESILIPRKGTLSNLFYVNEPFWSVDTMFWSKIKQDLVLPKYLYYTLKTYNLAELNVGSAVPSLTTEVLNKVLISIPDKNTQTSITEILTSFDDKIELNNKINKELESLAQSLFKQWFIDFEFPNENGEPYKSSGGEMIDSELGEIPKAWRVETLEKYVKIINGFAFKSEDYVKCGVKIIRTKNFNENGFLDLNDLAYLTDEKSKNYNNFQLQKYDKLLVMVGASIGKSVIVTSNILPALQNQNMWNFRAKSKEFQAYSNFLTDLIVEQNIGSATGSAREFFRKDFFYSIKIKIPTISLINQFNEIITTIYDKLDVLVIENLELTNLRDTLLSQLISGELEINENNN